MPGVAVTAWATPLTLMVAPEVHPGMRTRIDQVPPTLPVTLSVVVSSAGYEVVWVTVMPRWVQSRTEGRKRFTVRVVPSWK